MKLDKLIYDVREALKQYSDDSEISDRYIVYLYGIKRAKYLRQDLNNYQRTSDNSIKQTFCIDLEEVSANECGLDLECDTILRTTKTIPTPIELHTKEAISSVKPTNRLAVSFNYITKNRVQFLDGAHYKKALYSFLDPDGHIYVVSSGNTYKLLECLTITGVFDDPTELATFSNCCGCEDATPCFSFSETEYPIQPHYIDVIRQEIVQDLMRFIQIPEDKENDTTDLDIEREPARQRRR